MCYKLLRQKVIAVLVRANYLNRKKNKRHVLCHYFCLYLCRFHNIAKVKMYKRKRSSRPFCQILSNNASFTLKYLHIENISRQHSFIITLYNMYYKCIIIIIIIKDLTLSHCEYHLRLNGSFLFCIHTITTSSL